MDLGSGKSLEEDIAACLPVIESILEGSLQKEGKGIGMAGGIVIGNKLIWRKGFGGEEAGEESSKLGSKLGSKSGENEERVDCNNINNIRRIRPESLFRCGSITKSFTCLAVLQLISEGRIPSLDTPISQYIPELSVINKEKKNITEEITIGMLCSHSSGLPQEGNFDRWEGTPMPDLQTIIENGGLAQINTIHDGYPKFHYSNIGYILLGVIIQRLSGGYIHSLHTKILQPLQMNASTFQFNLAENIPNEVRGYRDGIPAPLAGYGDCMSCGGLLTSLIDLAKYLSFSMLGGREDLLPDHLLTHMQAPHVLIGFKHKYALAYGLGIYIQCIYILYIYTVIYRVVHWGMLWNGDIVSFRWNLGI